MLDFGGQDLLHTASAAEQIQGFVQLSESNIHNKEVCCCKKILRIPVQVELGRRRVNKSFHVALQDNWRLGNGNKWLHGLECTFDWLLQ